MASLSHPHESGNDDSDDTFSDSINKENVNAHQNVCDDDFDFGEQVKPLRLKPSTAQKQTERVPDDSATDVEEEQEEHTVSIQSSVLSQYLKPTNILSKYQQSQPADQRGDEQEVEEEEEEETEWPTSKEELEFDQVTQIKNNHAEIEESANQHEQEQKMDYNIIGFEPLYSELTKQAIGSIPDSDIVTADFRQLGWWAFIALIISGGCAIGLKSDTLREERDAIFKIAKLRLDLGDTAHSRCLITLWMRLTSDARPCDKTGSHWQQIGFQGNDPCTDVRGAGMLGLLQLIHMAENYSDIMSHIYNLSLNEHQHFPLVAVSFNITGIVLQLLRSCLSYRDINRKQSVMQSINQVYVALFYHFYLRWKQNSRTIIDFDAAHKELEQQAFSNWQLLVKQLKKREQEIKDNYQRLQDDDEEEVFGVQKRDESKHKTAKNKTRQNKYHA